MDDDWQEAAFSSRHVHNRVGRHSGRGKANAAFDARHTFGTYALDASGLQRNSSNKPSASHPAITTSDRKSGSTKLEIFRLTPNGDGLIGFISIPSVLEATIILAGNRKTLQATIEGMEEPCGPSDGVSNANVGDSDDGAGDRSDSSLEAEGGQDTKPSSASDCAEEPDLVAEQRRFQTFEKNSFRVPKFWMAWRGGQADASTSRTSAISTHNASAESGSELSGSGYLVFSGNNCQRFRGTMSCEHIGWDNVNIKGWKEISRSSRDTIAVWSPCS